MNIVEHARLADRASRLKKAWLCALAIRGRGSNVHEDELEIPVYATFASKTLKRHIEALELDLADIANDLLLDWKRTKLSSTVAWLSEQYERWRDFGFGLFDLGRLHDVERAIGKFRRCKLIDFPPYAQVLLQGFFGAAIRHPEYHLARDLALLFNLLLDAEAILQDAERRNAPSNDEYRQSLARSVILTCFNLLEAFVSGIATAYLLENPNAPESIVRTLRNEDKKKRSLRERFVLFPSLITGRSGLLDETCAPLKPLFGECKQQRDSFVHCEPGPKPTKWGYVKEHHFHDVPTAGVRKTIDLTCEAICIVWRVIHGRERPSWLPKLDPDGRFPLVHVSLHAAD